MCKVFFFCACVQDVDSAYLVKADLEDKVGSLTDEINFLRNIYEEVLFLLLNILAVVVMHHLPVVSITHFWSSVYTYEGVPHLPVVFHDSVSCEVNFKHGFS